MKTSRDPRHQARINRVQSLFAYTFQDSIPNTQIAEIIAILPSIDALIQEAAPEWPLAKINKLDLSVLRQAVYELLTSDTPAKVIIDEAVEIGKTYGSDNSSSFINGVLGTVLTKKGLS